MAIENCKSESDQQDNVKRSTIGLQGVNSGSERAGRVMNKSDVLPSQLVLRQLSDNFQLLCCQFVPGRFWRLMTKDVLAVQRCSETAFRQFAGKFSQALPVANFLSLGNLVIAGFLLNLLVGHLLASSENISR